MKASDSFLAAAPRQGHRDERFRLLRELLCARPQDAARQLSGGLASMGAVVLYAIAAKFARSDRPSSATAPCR